MGQRLSAYPTTVRSKVQILRTHGGHSGLPIITEMPEARDPPSKLAGETIGTLAS